MAFKDQHSVDTTKHWFLGLTDLLKVKRTETHSMIIDF